jgi:predicted membrane GTPase involved in stress response
MEHSEFPVERLVQLASTPFQAGFARQAARVLEPAEQTAYAATADGLLVRAATEDELARPMPQLRDAYGDDLVLRPPRVRYRSLGDRSCEPIMRLRVCVEPCHRDAMRADLATREATILAEHETPDGWLLQGEAPLRRLLGYGAALSRLTAGTGRYWTALDRYVPLEGPPGGWAA